MRSTVQTARVSRGVLVDYRLATVTRFPREGALHQALRILHQPLRAVPSTTCARRTRELHRSEEETSIVLDNCPIRYVLTDTVDTIIWTVVCLSVRQSPLLFTTCCACRHCTALRAMTYITLASLCWEPTFFSATVSRIHQCVDMVVRLCLGAGTLSVCREHEHVLCSSC